MSTWVRCFDTTLPSNLIHTTGSKENMFLYPHPHCRSSESFLKKGDGVIIKKCASRTVNRGPDFLLDEDRGLDEACLKLGVPAFFLFNPWFHLRKGCAARLNPNLCRACGPPCPNVSKVLSQSISKIDSIHLG